MEKFDLVVIGGGISGCAAAYIGAKLNLKTLLIEKNNFLGGLSSGGLVIPAMKTDCGKINTEFYEKLIGEAKKFNAQITYKDGNRGWFNPELLKIALEDMLINSGVKILYETIPYDIIKFNNKLIGLKIKTKMLSLHIYSDYFIDSTGNSKIFQLLDEEFLNEKNEKQASSLRFIMSGIDIKKFEKFITKVDKDRNVTNSAKIGDEIHLTTAYTWDNKNWGLAPIFKKALENGDLEPFDTAYFQIFTIAGAKGSVAFNCPRLPDYDESDPYSFSNSLIEARKSIFRLSNFTKKYFKGFENAYISNIASITGIRDGNRIIPKEICTKKTLYSGKLPKRAVLSGDYPIDIHSNSKDKSTLEKTGKYYLSIDSLISKNHPNLLCAGRNVGADYMAHSALRTQISCMSMGEAAARYVKDMIDLYAQEQNFL